MFTLIKRSNDFKIDFENSQLFDFKLVELEEIINDVVDKFKKRTTNATNHPFSKDFDFKAVHDHIKRIPASNNYTIYSVKMTVFKEFYNRSRHSCSIKFLYRRWLRIFSANNIKTQTNHPKS